MGLVDSSITIFCSVFLLCFAFETAAPGVAGNHSVIILSLYQSAVSNQPKY